jgi:glycosyltransferase involved in cell wall biosynthesis
MKRAKVVHDNLNAGGGSERLAFATIELLNEMNFVIDLATLQKPNLKEAEQNFGNDTSYLWKFNQIELLDMYSLLDLEEIIKNLKEKNKSANEENNEINNKTNKSRYNDDDYDLIINTHGDLFPYYNVNKEHNNKNHFLEMNQKKENKINIKSSSPTIKITYCHYPLVPQLIKSKDYSFLEIFFGSINEFPQKIKDMIATKILEKYNQMMENTFILTNSKFSKQAIEKIYGNNSVEATIIYPPVDVSKFNIFKNVSNKDINNPSEKDHNSILVISRISPDKKIENAIEIGKNLKEKENIDYYDMTIVGNIILDDKDYLEKLNNLISKYDLKDKIKIKPDVPFGELQKLLEKSSIYFHPTPNEPFGISIVEAMSAGLIPITPSWGDAEFVPSKYQYQSIEHAIEIIAKIIKNKIENNLSKERKNISDLTDKFSKQKYKEHVRNVIESLLENK